MTAIGESHLCAKIHMTGMSGGFLALLLPLVGAVLTTYFPSLRCCWGVPPGGQQMSLPHLTAASLWKQSGRWNTAGHELMRLQDRRKHDFCLGAVVFAIYLFICLSNLDLPRCPATPRARVFAHCSVLWHRCCVRWRCVPTPSPKPPFFSFLVPQLRGNRLSHACLTGATDQAQHTRRQ